MKPKKHHYVPQSVLRRFSIGGAERQVWVFDKKEGRSFSSAITAAGQENYFYALEVAGERVVFEELFDRVDAAAPQVISQLLANRTLAALSPESKAVLAAFTAVQLLRVKLPRTTIRTLPGQLAEAFSTMGISASEIPEISEHDARAASLKLLLGSVPPIAHTLEAKDLALLTPPSDSDHFLIGDNPVVMANSFPYGDIGLRAPGVEIYIPISSDLTLGFYCPTIRRQLDELEEFGEGRYATHLEALRSGRPLILEPEVYRYLQGLQVQTAHRFLFSPVNEFAIVQELLEQSPDLAEVNTLLDTGWEGYTRRERMPEGTWLVVFGQRNHRMIPVFDVRSDAEPPWNIYFRCRMKELMQATIADGPFERIVIVENRSITQEARRVAISEVPEGYCILSLW